jgi:putative membrane protein
LRRFARIAAFCQILQLSPAQLPLPRCDHALRAAPNALVRAAVAKAQVKNDDSNFEQAEQKRLLTFDRAQEDGCEQGLCPRRRMNGVFSMNRASAARRIACFGFAPVLLSLAAGIGIANAQSSAPMEAPATLNAVDFNFVGQANLGAPFQVDSGRLAEKKGGSAAIRNYAHLMVTSHIPVADALTAILQRKNVTPSNALLHGAYDAMISTLKADHGAAFDRDYVTGQVAYQKGNAALFRQEIENRSDPELKQFARQTLPKIEDHLQRALRLAGASSGDSVSN